MVAGRFLAANGFADDRDHAIFRYNNAAQYVQAVNDYAALIAADPAAFTGYYRWDVYYYTTAGDVFKITWQPTRSNAQLLHPRSTRGPRGIVEQAEKSANTHVREAVPLLQPSGWPPNVDRHDRRDGPDLPERCLDHASTAAL